MKMYVLSKRAISTNSVIMKKNSDNTFSKKIFHIFVSLSVSSIGSLNRNNYKLILFFTTF